MAKKIKKIRSKSKAGKKTKYTCEACGVVLSVDNPCLCDSCDLVCCGQDMKMIAC